MFGSQYLLSGKRIYLLVLVLLLFISVVGVIFSMAGGATLTSPGGKFYSAGSGLDMFISKLRKKLEFDPNIRIIVIRGKGYKLEIPCRCGFLFSNRDCKTPPPVSNIRQANRYKLHVPVK